MGGCFRKLVSGEVICKRELGSYGFLKDVILRMGVVV